MSTLQQRCEALLGDIPGRGVGRIEIDQRVIEGVREAWAEVSRLAGHEGWLCLSDRVEPCPCAVERREGVFPLDGEWRLDDARSAHLRHLGEGRWRLRTLTRRHEPHPDGSYLLHRRVLRKRGGYLAYEVEWRLAPDALGERVYRPAAARFVGFEEADR